MAEWIMVYASGVILRSRIKACSKAIRPSSDPPGAASSPLSCRQRLRLCSVRDNAVTEIPRRGSVKDVDAASVPVIAVIAWQALFEQTAALRGQSVLMHGAARNVGAFAVQLARQAGIRVVGRSVTGSHNQTSRRASGRRRILA